MSNEELKPCPFCNSKNTHPIQVSQGYYVLCHKCGAGSGIARAKKTAINKWNKRA